MDIEGLLKGLKEEALLAVSGANLAPGIHQRLVAVFDNAVQELVDTGYITREKEEEPEDGA